MPANRGVKLTDTVHDAPVASVPQLPVAVKSGEASSPVMWIGTLPMLATVKLCDADAVPTAVLPKVSAPCEVAIAAMGPLLLGEAVCTGAARPATSRKSGAFSASASTVTTPVSL